MEEEKSVERMEELAKEFDSMQTGPDYDNPTFACGKTAQHIKDAHKDPPKTVKVKKNGEGDDEIIEGGDGNENEPLGHTIGNYTHPTSPGEMKRFNHHPPFEDQRHNTEANKKIQRDIIAYYDNMMMNDTEAYIKEMMPDEFTYENGTTVYPTISQEQKEKKMR